MSGNKLVIFGLGEQAEVAHYYFTNQTDYIVCAYVVDDEYATQGSITSGVPVLALSELISKCPPSDYIAFVALGYSQMNSLRQGKYRAMKELGYRCASFISPHANVFSKIIGENCFVLEDNTIQPFVQIGNNVTLWSGNHIGHHTKIHDDCFVTSHVVISGGCEIGERTFIGVNSTIRDHITIGKANMIGAGSLILSSTEDNSVFTNNMSQKSSVPSNRLRRI